MPDVNDPAQGTGSPHERLDRIEQLVTETCMHPAERIHLRMAVPARRRRTEREAALADRRLHGGRDRTADRAACGKVAPGGTASRPRCMPGTWQVRVQHGAAGASR
ncbi:MAG TPA: hypothetical protein VGH53_14870 [Streptosporangiaceae bacterium]